MDKIKWPKYIYDDRGKFRIRIRTGSEKKTLYDKVLVDTRTNRVKDLRIAIPPLIIATFIAVIVVYFIEKKIPYIPLFGAILISIFGGLTLYFNNPVFIYMKPTIINVVFSSTLFSCVELSTV